MGRLRPRFPNDVDVISSVFGRDSATLYSGQPAYSPVRTCGDGWHRVRIPKYFLAIHFFGD